MNENVSKMRDRINTIMIATLKTRKKLSKESGVSLPLLSKFLSGKCDISVTRFMKICRALGVSAEYIWFGDEK